jgi:hypothetical protein
MSENTEQQTVELCGNEDNNNIGYGCELPKGHVGRHQAAYNDGDETGTVSWENEEDEPYPGELRDLTMYLTGYLNEIKHLGETLETALLSNDIQQMRKANKEAWKFTGQRTLSEELPF